MHKALLDHGYLKYIEHWGSDERIIEAARMSTDKGFLGWGPTACDGCGGTGWKDPGHVCPKCEGKMVVPGDEKLLRYLYTAKPQHSTPFEMAGAVVEVQAPIMVFREWHRHRTQSFNELSARYTPLPDINYIPSVERLMVGGDGKNRQAGTIVGADALTEDAARAYRIALATMYKQQEALYQNALARGVPKELARSHVGVGRYSRMRASANLLNWIKFLTLRAHPKAMWEIRVYAEALIEVLTPIFPRTMALFQESRSC